VNKSQILQAIEQTPKSPYATPRIEGLRDSAVLVILHWYDDEWHILFTKRAEHLNAHPGQISFPGGRVEHHDESLEHTAMRETEEEVGIKRSVLEIEAQLTTVTTLTGYRIRPYVCFLDELPELLIDTTEVDVAFSVPLTFLKASENLKTVKREYQGALFKTFALHWEEHLIWGATAHMVADLVYRLRQAENT